MLQHKLMFSTVVCLQLCRTGLEKDPSFFFFFHDLYHLLCSKPGLKSNGIPSLVWVNFFLQKSPVNQALMPNIMAQPPAVSEWGQIPAATVTLRVLQYRLLQQQINTHEFRTRCSDYQSFWLSKYFCSCGVIVCPCRCGEKKRRNRMWLSYILTFSKHESELIAQHTSSCFYD